MSQKDETQQQKEDLNILNEVDKIDIQQNQSLNDGISNSRSEAPLIELKNQNAQENQEQNNIPKEMSNIVTPTRTSKYEVSTIVQTDQIQSGQLDKQSFNDPEQTQQEQIDQNNELELVGIQINEQDNYEEKDQKQSKKLDNQSEQEIHQKSIHSQQQSNKSALNEQITFLQSTLQMKDELIITMSDEISVLKQSQLDKEQYIETIEKKYEDKLEKLFNKIGKLEKQLKEKENDIEQYQNGNQTLHFQDLSVISVQKNDIMKSNLNEKKDVTIYEVLNEKQTTSDLSEFGNNFWLISAERKIQKSNPLYKDYFLKDSEADQPKNKIVINHPTKKYDKSYWFKYVGIKKPSRYQLPKLAEVNHQDSHNDPKIIHQQQIQQQIIQSIQQQTPFSYTQKIQNKINSVQQSIPFSQKLLANNQRSNSQQQNNNLYKNKMYASQPTILKVQRVSYDQEDFLADQEIQQMFAKQSPPKKQKIDWDSQPMNNYTIIQHTNSSQVIEQKEKFPILSQKLSYVNQYSHKKEISRINESQNNNRSKISKQQ